MFLKYFYSIKSNNSFDKLQALVNNAFKEQNTLTITQWRELLTTNSDILLLTLYNLFVYKPFYEENINFYISNFTTENPHYKIIEDKTLIYSLADSTELLYYYLNAHFKGQFDYVPMEETSFDSIDDLDDFEEEKGICVNEIEDGIITTPSTVSSQSPEDSKRFFSPRKRNPPIIPTTISNLSASKIEPNLTLLNKCSSCLPFSGKDDTAKKFYDSVKVNGIEVSCTIDLVNYADIIYGKFLLEVIKLYLSYNPNNRPTIDELITLYNNLKHSKNN